MTEQTILYGFDASTYVRTTRMVLAENAVDYDQVPVDVLKGEPHEPEHLARHPFGKVPVLDIDGMRLRETDAICRYIDETRDGPSLVPSDPKRRARMNEAIGLIDSYGYGAMIGVTAHHLFPDFIGGRDEERHQAWLAQTESLAGLLMDGADPWITGETATLADYFLAPLCFYVAMTPDADRVFALPGMRAWWEAAKELETFKATEPVLG